MRNGPYELVLAPPDYPGKRYRGKYCYEHHLVYWRTHGIIPVQGEVVHHKNENKRDNSPDNLELKTGRAHTAEHHRVPPVEVPCENCGATILMQPGQYRAKRAKQNAFFCGHSCQMKKQNPATHRKWRPVRSPVA